MPPGKSPVRILLAVVLLLALAAGGYRWFLRPVPVTTVAPERGDAAEIVYATGEVAPRFWARVAPLVRGRIESICRCEGERVEEGRVLARLDSREARARLAELRARAERADQDLQRLKTLAARGAVSQQALDQARSEAAQAASLVTAQQAYLAHHVLRAPLAGRVLRRDGEPGELAGPDMPLFWVGRSRPLRVVAEVNEEDIPRVAAGQRALVRSDAFPDRALHASVARITPKGDPVAKTYRVYLSLPDDMPLRVGMTVEANIVTRVSEHTLLLPARAFDGDAVYLVSDGAARRRVVSVGIRGIDRFEVLEGLSEQARVITPYPEDLDNGDRVSETGAGQ